MVEASAEANYIGRNERGCCGGDGIRDYAYRTVGLPVRSEESATITGYSDGKYVNRVSLARDSWEMPETKDELSSSFSTRSTMQKWGWKDEGEDKLSKGVPPKHSSYL
jgi:hypothetical protein